MTEILVVGLLYLLILFVQNWDEVKWSWGLVEPAPERDWMRAFTTPGVMGTILGRIYDQDQAAQHAFHVGEGDGTPSRPLLPRRTRSRLRRARDSYGPLDPRRHPRPM